MNHSLSIGSLAAALAKAQGEMQPAKKDAMNPFFNKYYADLAAIIAVIKGPLAKHGLAVSQGIEDSPVGIVIKTMLLHESGEWLLSGYTMPVAKHDAQGVGSAITYGKRYALAALCCVATEDDDGNAATQSAPVPAKAKASPVPLSAEFCAPNYGTYARQPLRVIPDEGLMEYLRGAKRSLDDPRKANYKAANLKMAEAIEAELAGRNQPDAPGADSQASPAETPQPNEAERSGLTEDECLLLDLKLALREAVTSQEINKIYSGIPSGLRQQCFADYQAALKAVREP